MSLNLNGKVHPLVTIISAALIVMFLLSQCEDEAPPTQQPNKPVSVEKPKLTESEKLQKTSKILADLKVLPATELAKNKALYQELVNLNPENEVYKTRLQEYSKKLQYKIDNPFTEKDFDFDNKSRPYKNIIIAGVNKVHRENNKCKKLSTFSADISGSQGTKSNPVFFVTCEYQGEYFNVFFSKSDIEKSVKLKAASNIDEMDALTKCKEYVLNRATHPSTVDFNILTGTSFNTFSDGRSVYQLSFSTKNSYNLEIDYLTKCYFEGETLKSGETIERAN